MRAIERKKARELRTKGLSLREIAERTGCAKSSISKWVQDISLTPRQIKRLELKQDKARAKAANHPNSPKQKWARIRNSIIDSGAKEIPSQCSLSTLKLIGAVLYWAEGYKATINMVNFSNSDPNMVALMMNFFRKVCKVQENRFRGMVHIHPHLDKEKAEKFWSEISGIPLTQFHKTQFGVSKVSKHKRDTLPLGTFRIVVCDARLFSKIKGWINGIQRWCGPWAVGAIG